MNYLFRRATPRWWVVGVSGLLVAGLIAGGWSSLATAQKNTGPRASAAEPAVRSEAAERGANFAKQLSHAFHSAAEQVLPSVVTITTTPPAPAVSHRSGAVEQGDEADDTDVPNPFEGTPFGDMFKGNPQFHQFFKFGMPTPAPENLVERGSGVVIDAAGVILTNNHVVKDAGDGGKVMVRLSDGREFRAQKIKTDPKTDLAVLRIEGAGSLKAAKLGDSDAMQVGDWVLALGQPFGLEGTVTAGIISAKARGLGLTVRENFLQTDAAINPGNSGGPLVNLDGEVVGINTAISTQSGGYQGVGFAIPANIAKWVSRQLVETGKVRRAYLGIAIQPVTAELADKLGVKVNGGVLVSDVPEGTPAARAGLKAGDVIVAFAGKPVAGPQELQGLVEESKIDSQQTMDIVRDGKRTALTATAAEQPADYGLVRGRIRGSGGSPESASFPELGIQVETLTPEVAQKLGVKADHGAVITEVRRGGLAQQAGLGTGMVITQANRKPIKTADDLRIIMKQQSLAKGLLLLVQTAEGSRFVVIQQR
ncbi:MAG: Do family serine endopeptidase [Thermoguttaceae bacterium]|jgi:serine protease Do